VSSVLWFLAGFLLRTAISYVSARTYRWRSERAWNKFFQRQLDDRQKATIMQWRVEIGGIEWDDGKGEYDVSDQPTTLTVIVVAEDEEDAIEYAMQMMDEQSGFLIADYEYADVSPIDR
jgi:hypothetical protein